MKPTTKKQKVASSVGGEVNASHVNPMIDKEYETLIFPPPKNGEGEDMDLVYTPLIRFYSDEREQTFFPPDFKTNDVVLKPLLKKYDERNKEREKLYFGIEKEQYTKTIQQNPFYKKADEKFKELLKQRKVSLSKIGKVLSVQLLDFDNSNDGVNRQSALFITKHGMVVCRGKSSDGFYPYEDLRLVDDWGIYEYPGAIKEEEPLINFGDIEELLWKFLNEYHLLRQPVLDSIGASHPSGLSHPFKGQVIAARQEYVSLLVDAAIAEGDFDAASAARLDYIIREFDISIEKAEEYFNRAFIDYCKREKTSPDEKEKYAREYRNRIRKFLEENVSNEKTYFDYVFLEDILELAIDTEGAERRTELLEFLRNKKFVSFRDHEEFFESYIEYIKERRKAEKKLRKAMQAHMYKEENSLATTMKVQNYNRQLNLEILRLGVNING